MIRPKPAQSFLYETGGVQPDRTPKDHKRGDYFSRELTERLRQFRHTPSSRSKPLIDSNNSGPVDLVCVLP